ncbi:MAG: hypothetical protein WDM89_02540 [Rhizomicrobium sp.]
MRFHMICVAALLALSSAAAIAQVPSSAQMTCTRQPRMAGQPVPPQLVAARQAARQACAADMEKYCANVPKSCGAPQRCLNQHAQELSASCTSARQNVRAMNGHRV